MTFTNAAFSEYGLEICTVVDIQNNKRGHLQMTSFFRKIALKTIQKKSQNKQMACSEILQFKSYIK